MPQKAVIDSSHFLLIASANIDEDLNEDFYLNLDFDPGDDKVLLEQVAMARLKRRVRFASAWHQWLEEERLEIIIPTPVYIELSRAQYPEELLAMLCERYTNLHHQVIDLPVAKIAGPMHNKYVPTTGPDRPGVKYDLMIAAAAIKTGADFVITANPRDFEKLLQGTSIQVVASDCTDVPAKTKPTSVLASSVFVAPGISVDL
jgi:predicted nucleic acid-binding protein